MRRKPGTHWLSNAQMYLTSKRLVVRPLRSTLASAALALTLASPSVALGSPPTQRPYAIDAVRYGVSVRFDDGECGITSGYPHVGPIESFWRPAPFDGVFTWGYTQDGIIYTFVPAFCSA